MHGWVAISVVQLVEAGDHTVVLGRVEDAGSYAGAPLTYYQRTFGTHQAF